MLKLETCGTTYEVVMTTQVQPAIGCPIMLHPWVVTHQSVSRMTFACTFDSLLIEGGMKRDGRGFDHRTLEAIRLMAVERVREGERPSSVVASFGFSRTTIYKWIKAASTPGVGLEALRSTVATGRPRSLSPEQEQQVFRRINGCDPRQYGLDFGCGRAHLWSA